MPDLTREPPHTWRGLRREAQCPAGADQGREQELQVLPSPALLRIHRWVSRHSNNIHYKRLLSVPRGASPARAERNKCFSLPGLNVRLKTQTVVTIISTWT